MDEKLTLLIVDDDLGDRKNIIRNCEQSGLKGQYLEAEDLPAALALLEKTSPDCILIDYALPGEDGLSGLSKIQKYDPYTPIIMVTCRGNEIVASRAFKSGVIDYLSKEDISSISLPGVIEEAIAKKSEQQELDEQRLELERFSDILAHDLQAPVVHISNFVDIIDYDLEKQDYSRLKEHLAYIKKSARNLSNLVKTLGEFSHANKTVPMEMVPLSASVKVAMEMLHDTIEEASAEIRVNELPVVRGNSALLGQLFQNLIANALKFNQSGQPVVEISANKIDGKVRVCVKDNGIGIHPDNLKEIFKPFKRLHGKHEYNGSGLGLATVERIVRRHGGRIWVESEPGSGAAFHIELKAAD